MKTTPSTKDIQEKIDNALDNVPGAAVGRADDKKVDKELVDQRTRMQNRNPRDIESAMPKGEQDL